MNKQLYVLGNKTIEVEYGQGSYTETVSASEKFSAKCKEIVKAVFDRQGKK